MRCEKFTCSLKRNCEQYLRKSKYKIIFENPSRNLNPDEKCEYHIPLNKQ